MDLASRVTLSADMALADHQYASFVDVLSGMGLLHNVEMWHNGRVQYVDEMMQGGPEKLLKVIDIFEKWAVERGLRREDLPPHAAFISRPPKYAVASRYPVLEQAFRRHFVSPHMPEKKLEKLRERFHATAPPTVFSIAKESKCSQCNEDLWKGDFLTMQGNQPLCLQCSDLGHLVYLESGDTALTRRATKHSGLWAVVVRFSRTRGRYERRGVLVTPEALEKAEEECLGDADLRAVRQARDAQKRQTEDLQLAAHMAAKILALYPGCPPGEARGIAAHTASRGSGRVGRSAARRALDDQALELAVAAWVRHRHTRYDELLMRGAERTAARNKIRADVDGVLDRWVAGREQRSGSSAGE
jgi:hypothetical protein